MEIEVTQENLNKALQVVAKVAGGRSSLPILNNILIKIINNQVVLSATNLDIAISKIIGAKVVKSGSITVPARLMQDFINSLPSGTVKIKQEDHKLNINSGNYKSVINGVSAEEFPVMPEIKDGQKWQIPAQDFKNSLNQVVFTASSDETRPVLTGVYLHGKDKNIFIAATDSYRLAEKKINTKNKLTNPVIVPASALNDLIRVISDSDEVVEVINDDQQILFKVDNIEIVARLIDGSYPKYQQLIPSGFTNQVVIKREDLISITKVSSLFAREAAGSVTINTDEEKQTVNIKSIASQVGENDAKADAKVTGSGNITLNSRYLLEGLQAINSETVVFSFNGKLEPIVVRAEDSNDYTHLIMPLKS